MRRALRCLGIVGLFLVGVGCWPAPGQGPDRQAHNPFEQQIAPATVADVEVKWTASSDEGAVDDPIVWGSTVYFAAGDKLYGVAAVTGTRRWVRQGQVSGFATPMSTPIADGDRVLASQGMSNFGGAWLAEWLDAATGAPLGEIGAGVAEGLRGSAALLSSVGVLSGDPSSATIEAEVVDLDDPAGGWRGLIDFLSIGDTAAPMTLGTARFYQGGVGTMLEPSGPPTHTANGVRAFPVATEPPSCGLPLAPELLCPIWSTATDGTTTTSPVLASDESTVYVGTSAGTVYALDAASGAVEWTAAVGAGVVASPALANGRLYVPTDDGDLVALDADGCGAATCSPLWQGTTAGPIRSQPAVAGGVVFTGSADEDGTVAAFDAAGCGAATCSSLWDVATGSPVSGAPAVSSGQLYVGTTDGLLHAFGLP